VPVHRRLLRGGHHILGHIGGVLKQPRPRYEPWQNQMVDPSHGGGQFGATGIGGEGMLLGALPGMAYRSALGRLPMKFVRNAVKDTGGRMVPQSPALGSLWKSNARSGLPMSRGIRRDPSMYGPVRPNTTIPHHMRHILRPQFGGRRGSRFGQTYRRAGTTIDDLKREILDKRKRAWVQTRSGTYINPDDILR
jgi:hypothetical protein